MMRGNVDYCRSNEGSIALFDRERAGGSRENRLDLSLFRALVERSEAQQI